MLRFALILAVLTGMTAGSVGADESSDLWPDIPAASGAPHPEGNQWWRENHMDLLRHDRDMTVREGDRDIDASLKECFTCHAATDESGAVVTYESEKHFCRACHEFVAVQVDCFMCHRSTPDGVDESVIQSIIRPKWGVPDLDALLRYLGLDKTQGQLAMNGGSE